jgi:hypothetical protein
MSGDDVAVMDNSSESPRERSCYVPRKLPARSFGRLGAEPAVPDRARIASSAQPHLAGGERRPGAQWPGRRRTVLAETAPQLVGERGGGGDA